MKSQQSRFSLTDEDMAAQILLLVAFFSNNILAEILKMEGDSHHFILNKTADDVCLISRWIGEEKELLWNSSQHHNSSLQRRASYTINPLEVSDSGQYQEQCWTQNNVTHERNSTLLVCGTRKTRYKDLYPYVGQTMELNCDVVGPNQSVQWVSSQYNHRTRNDELALIDDETSSMYKQPQVKNKSSLLVTFDVSSGLFNYYCLEKNHQSCELLEEFNVIIQHNYIHSSVGESLELNCSDFSGNKPHVWKINSVTEQEVSHNYTLTFPSLTLNHTGSYTCDRGGQYDLYFLFVCPESDPPADVFFTGGENVTLPYGDWKQPDNIHWFMKTNGTEGRTSIVFYQGQKERIFHSNTSLVITNISLEDSGEFWCVVIKDGHCVFTSKTLVMFGEPEVDQHLVRSVLLSVVIFMMSVVVVTVVVVWRSRSREHLPVPVEEVEMLDVSPASADVQPETL